MDATAPTVLGGGSYGKVLASMCPDGRMAAIKLFRKRDALDDARQEVAMHQKLMELPSGQRWFAEMLHHDMHGEPFPWIAFSHEGANLGDVLMAHGPLAEDVVEPFALQLASALEALHSQAGLLHLDLKPGNILWSVELRRLKLIDFGLSEPFAKGRVVENPRFFEYVSLPYRPPELWHVGSDLQSLQAALGPKVDLWSFGCVLFEVCSGSMLMEPLDKRQKSPKHIIGDWCAHWQELQFLCKSKKEQKNSNHWLARLLRCRDWCLVVLSLCHPLPKDRKLLKKKGQIACCFAMVQLAFHIFHGTCWQVFVCKCNPNQQNQTDSHPWPGGQAERWRWPTWSNTPGRKKRSAWWDLWYLWYLW